MKIKNIILVIKDQLPLKKLFRNFFITGIGWGLFSLKSHIRQKNGRPKLIYKTKENALKVSLRMSKKIGKNFNSYKCLFCDGYHIGKS